MVDVDDERSGPDQPSGADQPSGPPPFDSMANLRALGDIQRRGLEAANLVVTRVISQVERSGPIFGAEPPPRSTDDLAGTEIAPPVAQRRGRVFSGYRETADGTGYVYDRPRGLFQAPPRPVEQRYFVVPRAYGYEVPPPQRYYYYDGR